jgi:hypothetical protein
LQCPYLTNLVSCKILIFLEIKKSSDGKFLRSGR